MWEEFDDVIDNPEENFFVEVYKGTKTISAMREVIESGFECIYKSDKGLDLYPEQMVNIENHDETFSGRMAEQRTEVEIIFLFLRSAKNKIKRHNLVKKVHENVFWRIISIRDMKSHIEAICQAIVKPSSSFNKFSNGSSDIKIK